MGDKPDPSAKDDPKPDPTDDLGDKGKKALDDERRARREAERKAKDLEERLKALEDKDKSETERANSRAEAAERKAAEAESKLLRFEVASEKGVKARWLSGSTREELEAAADEYLADHPPANGGGTPPPGKPKEDLKGGGDPDEQPIELDPRKLAESVPRL